MANEDACESTDLTITAINAFHLLTEPARFRGQSKLNSKQSNQEGHFIRPKSRDKSKAMRSIALQKPDGQDVDQQGLRRVKREVFSRGTIATPIEVQVDDPPLATVGGNTTHGAHFLGNSRLDHGILHFL